MSSENGVNPTAPNSAHNSNFSLLSVLGRERLTGPNYMDWMRNLRFTLRYENKEYVLDEPIATINADSTQEEIEAHQKHYDDAKKVSCIIAYSMSPELQKTFENTWAYEMNQQLKEMFQAKASKERLDVLKSLMACKSKPGASIYDFVLEMKGTLTAAHVVAIGHNEKKIKISHSNWKGKAAKGKSDYGSKRKTEYDIAPMSDPREAGINESMKLKHGELNLVMGNKKVKLVTRIRKYELMLKSGGCVVFVRQEAQDKLEARSEKCLFIGYPEESFGYVFYKPTDNVVFVARRGMFIEREMISKKDSGSKIGLEKIQESADEEPIVNIDTQQEVVTHVEPDDISLPICKTSSRVSNPPQFYYGFHREEDKISDSTLSELDEPDNYKEVMTSPEAAKWKEAMKSEIQYMYDNQVWNLVDTTPGLKIVG
ncbi:retrotransposon protein, putative, ty1-copia subclass [Tanacetum coccineum]